MGIKEGLVSKTFQSTILVVEEVAGKFRLRLVAKERGGA